MSPEPAEVAEPGGTTASIAPPDEPAEAVTGGDVPGEDRTRRRPLLRPPVAQEDLVRRPGDAVGLALALLA
ncbi:MAG TPA: hypothetical protein PKA98_20205, partial [Acidimicrobiales bacterium]|nr:hypothetical protein [Acidimicrobiales bacterium]